MAALAAYPDLSVNNKPKFVNPGSKFAQWHADGTFEMEIENTLDPTDEAVYEFADKVFTEVARVLRAGGPFAITFSNRCFPTKAIRGWLLADDAGHCAIVDAYFDHTDGFDPAVVQLRNPGVHSDPLYAVVARRWA